MVEPNSFGQFLPRVAQAIASSFPFSLVGLLKDCICFLKQRFSQKSYTFPLFSF